MQPESDSDEDNESDIDEHEFYSSDDDFEDQDAYH